VQQKYGCQCNQLQQKEIKTINLWGRRKTMIFWQKLKRNNNKSQHVWPIWQQLSFDNDAAVRSARPSCKMRCNHHAAHMPYAICCCMPFVMHGKYISFHCTYHRKLHGFWTEFSVGDLLSFSHASHYLFFLPIYLA